MNIEWQIEDLIEMEKQVQKIIAEKQSLIEKDKKDDDLRPYITHKWIRIRTGYDDLMKLIDKDEYDKGIGRQYRCITCGIEYIHRYGNIEDIDRNIAYYRISDECYRAHWQNPPNPKGQGLHSPEERELSKDLFDFDKEIGKACEGLQKSLDAYKSRKNII